MKALVAVSALLLTVACTQDDGLIQAGQAEHIDVQLQSERPKLDVLWVIDNSRSMAAEQSKINTFAGSFFRGLVEAKVDLHVGVISSDPAESGVLRQFSRSVRGCENCRFISSQVGCEDPSQAASCDQLLVFQDLVIVGTDGSALERPFEQVATAVGLEVLDAETGTPRRMLTTGAPILTPPESNLGFLRTDADLLLVFISDEDEGLGEAAAPVRYYERLFSSIKSGTEQRLLVGALAGWPELGEFEGRSDDVCAFVEELKGGDGASTEEFRRTGCTDPDDAAGYADPGLRFAELSCRLGGTFARICDTDYTESLRELGDRAVNFSRSFRLSQASRLERGEDCVLFTADDVDLDCDQDGTVDGPLDGPICVIAGIGGDEPRPISRSTESGWTWDAAQSAVVFPGDVLPDPETEVRLRYAVTRGVRTCP